jgi:hypothetical protein
MSIYKSIRNLSVAVLLTTSISFAMGDGERTEQARALTTVPASSIGSLGDLPSIDQPSQDITSFLLFAADLRRENRSSVSLRNLLHIYQPSDQPSDLASFVAFRADLERENQVPSTQKHLLIKITNTRYKFDGRILGG